MNNAYPRMINMKRDQKHLRTYNFLLFEVIQELSSML